MNEPKELEDDSEELANVTIKRFNELEKHQRNGKELTKVAFEMEIPLMHMDLIALFGIPPLPTKLSLSTLNNFFPAKEIIFSLNCQRCVWEKCLASTFNRKIKCFVQNNNYQGKTFHSTFKNGNNELPTNTCVLIILPHNCERLLRWLKKLTTNSCQYLAVLVAKDWIKCLE